MRLLKRQLLSVWIATACVGAPVAAQDKKMLKATEADQLARLVRELEALTPGAYDARIKALAQRIKAHTAAAGKLRKQAAALERKAKSEDAKAKRVEADIERLRKLMALVKPSGNGAAKAAAMAKSANAKAKPAKAKSKAAKPRSAKPQSAAKKPGKSKSAKPKAANPMPAKATEVRLITYQDHIRPIFEERCIVCHDDGDASGGLDLSSHRAAMEGGSSGATIIAGSPDSSRLFQLVSYQERPFMPKNAEKLANEQLALIREWIALGAPVDAKAAKANAKKLSAAKQRAAKNQPAVAVFEGPPPMPSKVPSCDLATVVQAPAIKSTAASPRAPLVAVTGHRQVLLVHTETLEVAAVLPFPLGQVEVVEFSTDGSKLLAAGGTPGKRGGAILFDVESGAEVRRFGPERDTVLAASISPGQSIVALGGPSRKVRAYATATGERLYEITNHNDWILACDISSDGNFLATADRSGIVSVWEADTGRNVHTINPKSGAVNAVAFRPDSRALVIAAHNGRIRSYELEDAKQLWSKNHGAAVLSVIWSSEQRLASCGVRGRVKLWKADGGSLATSPRLGDWVYSVAFGVDGRIFAGDWSGRSIVIEAAGKKVVRSIVPAMPVASS